MGREGHNFNPLAAQRLESTGFYFYIIFFKNFFNSYLKSTCNRMVMTEEHRLHLWCKKRQRQLSPEEVLGTPEGVAVFAKWAPATELSHRRYNDWDVFGEGEDNGAQEQE